MKVRLLMATICGIVASGVMAMGAISSYCSTDQPVKGHSHRHLSARPSIATETCCDFEPQTVPQVGSQGGQATGKRSDRADATRFVHDPCIIKQGDTYYIFSTGRGIPIRSSKDLIHWEMAGRVFAADVPKWAVDEIPGSTSLWAPDIAYLNGRYYLYYSVSTFGKNRSLIGLVTNKTLDQNSPDYAWKDEGKVVESFPQDGYNAIDSNLLILEGNKLGLVFGSFWSGIQYVEADPQTGKPRPGAAVRCIVRRPGSTAEEAPFLIHRGGYYYLFVSFDLCCKGTASTYNIRIGRSRSVDGPYLDREGKPMLEGGGTLLLGTTGSVIGPGHCAVLREPGRDLLVYHYYDADANGIPTLQIRPLTWDKDNWPQTEPPLNTLK